MGSFSIWHWLILLVVVLLLFGGAGKIPRLMNDMAKGVTRLQIRPEGRRRGGQERGRHGAAAAGRRPAGRRTGPQRRAQGLTHGGAGRDGRIDRATAGRVAAQSMFDLSWTEILVIGVAALIFIGPKELPGALRTAGKFVSKARQMAREFQGNVEEMVRKSELDEIKKQVDKVATGDLTRSIESQIDPKGEISIRLLAADPAVARRAEHLAAAEPCRAGS